MCYHKFLWGFFFEWWPLKPECFSNALIYFQFNFIEILKNTVYKIDIKVCVSTGTLRSKFRAYSLHTSVFNITWYFKLSHRTNKWISIQKQLKWFSRTMRFFYLLYLVFGCNLNLLFCLKENLFLHLQSLKELPIIVAGVKKIKKIKTTVA